jgi:2-phosphoglycerate kinase
MIYFVGGPPRVGKSIIAKAITTQHGISAVSTDSLGAEPGLFAITRFNEMTEADRIRLMVRNTTRRIDYQIEESTAVWRAVKPYILREQDERRDLVVEGVAVLPEMVAQLKGVNYRAVFVGNQGDKQKENIKTSGKDNEHDWMRHASSEYIEAFAVFIVAMSRYIEEEACRYGFEYIEMDRKPFNDAVAEVVASLLG